MERLAAEGQMKSFYHSGFWQCMDTQREMKSWRPYGSREMRPGKYGRMTERILSHDN